MCGPVLVTRFPIKIRIYSCDNMGISSSVSDTDISFVIWDSFGSHTLAINNKKLEVRLAVSFSVASNEPAGHGNWNVDVNSTVHQFYRCVITKHCEVVSSLDCQEIAQSFCYGILRINTTVTRGQPRTASVHSLSLNPIFVLFSH